MFNQVENYPQNFIAFPILSNNLNPKAFI